MNRMASAAKASLLLGQLQMLQQKPRARGPFTLCENCYPEWEDTEVLTIPPLKPCEACGQSGPRHVFRSDPRPESPDGSTLAKTDDLDPIQAANLVLPVRDRAREAADALAAKLDSQLRLVIEEYLQAPLDDLEILRDRLGLIAPVDDPQGEEDPGEVYAMDGVPLLWVGRVKASTEGNAAEGFIFTANRPMRRYKLPDRTAQ